MVWIYLPTFKFRGPFLWYLSVVKFFKYTKSSLFGWYFLFHEEKKSLFPDKKFPSALDIKLRTEYLEALDVLEVVEATDFVSVATGVDAG